MSDGQRMAFSPAPLQIYACGDQVHTATDELPDLKAMTQDATGKAYRRIGRFIQLALIGAARCALGREAPASTAVYFASGRGDLEVTVDIMTQLFRDAQTPKPLAFVNTVSNAACFYVAQLLNLQSPSNYVCNRYFAFESALRLAQLDVRMGKQRSVLVGSVDAASAPLSDHRRRLHLAPDATVGEASHWLWLGPKDASRPRLGELIDVRHFDNRDALLQWIAQHSLADARCMLSAGQYIDAKTFESIQHTAGFVRSFDYRSDRGHYDSHSGAVIGAFLRAPTSQSRLLHLNADADGRYGAMLVER